MESITLYFRQGSSDKIYQAAIEPNNGGYLVTFAYGRRGSTPSTGTKTQSPVSHDEAKAIYEKLIREKTAKGYTPGADGTPYQQTERENQTTGIHCQLLNPGEEHDAEKLIEDSAYWMQEKWDGRRLLLYKQDGKITGINRRGLAVALPEPLMRDAQACPEDFTLDGEAVGDMLSAFDLLLIGDDDVHGRRYTERLLLLANLLSSFGHPGIHLTETAHLPEENRHMLEHLKFEGREGVVFKHVDAPYIAGRPASGGSQLKHKFHETASFIVGKINAKRSVTLYVYAGKNLKTAVNVTIPPNHPIPEKEQVVEYRYLYAFRESGSIYQPVYLGARDDIPAEECTVSQLKYKSKPEPCVA